MADIYEHIPMSPETKIGYVDADGKIFAQFDDGSVEYIGWIDYEEGDIYDEEDGLMGWIEENGEVVASYEEDDFAIGRVAENGNLYLFGEEGEDDILVGRIDKMEDPSEGAAALLFFFDEEGYEGEEEE